MSSFMRSVGKGKYFMPEETAEPPRLTELFKAVKKLNNVLQAL